MRKRNSFPLLVVYFISSLWVFGVVELFVHLLFLLSTAAIPNLFIHFLSTLQYIYLSQLASSSYRCGCSKEIMSYYQVGLLQLEFLFLLLLQICSAINTDGILLLSFKFSILSDPLNILQDWNYYDPSPCYWTGVVCSSPSGIDGSLARVVALSVPNSQLLGSIPADLISIEHLHTLDLSNNSLNGSLPATIFNATQLRSLDLSNNLFSGQIPDTVAQLHSLVMLNLSDNALTGNLPLHITCLQNLTELSLTNNYFTGGLPSGFNSVEVLQLSSNLINGSLPPDFGGKRLRYFNISYNRVSGSIPKEFAADIPGNATLDLSFNNLTGEIPDSTVFFNQKSGIFSGNSDLCGRPTFNPCPIPSSPLVNSSAQTSPPALAVIPKPATSGHADSANKGQSSNRLRTGTIVGIVLGDVAGVAILFVVFFYVYYFIQERKKKKKIETEILNDVGLDQGDSTSSSSSSESRGFTRWSCLRKKSENNEDDSDSSTSDTYELDSKSAAAVDQSSSNSNGAKNGTLVSVDGEKELELESLLRASAYILGATGSSIVYKAVLEDGTSLAVRRIGETHVERFRDFENQVRITSRLVHPNLVRIRGFYWGPEEKLIIYDFVPNGSLANARYRKAGGGSSPCHLPWESRLKIARGVARGLSFLHDKKHVHGNLKPNNILLGLDMEPKLGDFGLEKLITGDTSSKAGGSARNFGSKRSTASRDDLSSTGPSPSPSPSSIGGLSPYHAPESLRSIKPNPKWDVYSFGVILLELLTGKVIIVDETGQGSNGLAVEDNARALRMADVSIRADVEGKEEALLACFKLGYSCASPIPHKRPNMKEALQILDRIPTPPPASSAFLYGL